MQRMNTYNGTKTFVSIRPALLRLPLILLLSVLLFVGGCSVVRTAYNNLNWVVTYYLAKHFELDSEQKKDLRVMVDRNLSWHRETQLPLYSEFLGELSDSLNKPVTPEEAGEAYTRMLDFWDSMMLQIVPDTQAFLSNLSDEQIEQMIVRMEENNQEMYDKYSGVTPEQREARRNKNTIKAAERVLGKLNEEQKMMIASSLADMEDATEDWVDNRRLWQAEFISLVRERPPEQEYTERLTHLFVYPRQYDEPEFQAVIDRNLGRSLNLTADLLNSLSDKQRKRAQQRLGKFATDFERLAATP